MNKNIVIMNSNPLFKDIEPVFSRALKKKKYYVIYVVNSLEDKNFYMKKFPDCFNEVLSIKNEFEYIKISKNSNLLADQARLIEDRLGISIGRLFMIERTIGRGFHASGGYNHPKTKLHFNSDHYDLLKIAIEKTKFWEKLLNTKKVSLCLNLPNVAHYIALKKNMISLRANESRFEKRFYWTKDYYRQPDGLEKTFKNLKKKKFRNIVINSPQLHYMEQIPAFVEELKFHKTFVRAIFQVLKRIYGRIRGYRKGKNFFIFDEFLYIWRKRNEFLSLRKLSSIKKDDLKDMKYIYFPLITEPEIALHGVAQDFFFQLSAINMIARDLPADYYLVVKEHLLSIGRRPSDFYNQIVELKNVKIADPLDLGVPYLKNADAVACITGSSGWEALAMGIPVISFSKNNAYNFLKHAFTVKMPDDTKIILENICNKKWPSPKSLQDGAKFYESTILDSFDLYGKSSFTQWKNIDYLNDKRFQKYANKLYKKLIEKKKTYRKNNVLI